MGRMRQSRFAVGGGALPAAAWRARCVPARYLHLPPIRTVQSSYPGTRHLYVSLASSSSLPAAAAAAAVHAYVRFCACRVPYGTRGAWLAQAQARAGRCWRCPCCTACAGAAGRRAAGGAVGAARPSCRAGAAGGWRLTRGHWGFSAGFSVDGRGPLLEHGAWQLVCTPDHDS